MFVRKMTRADVPYVLEIQMKSFGLRTPDDFDKCIANPLFYYAVALIDKTVVGYFGCSLIQDECELLTIAVDENFRRQHIGTFMIEKMIEIARFKKCKKVFLEVDQTNAGALALYEKFGFVREFVRKKYYGENDAIVMSLKL